jgi:hypothetical protein
MFEQLNNVTNTFLVSRDVDRVFRIFRGEQRAIGEIMAVTLTEGEDPGRRACIGYAAFVARQKHDPEFRDWFEKLRNDIQLLIEEPGKHHQRLALLQHALVDLINFLDPDCIRFASEHRTKISTC